MIIFYHSLGSQLVWSAYVNSDRAFRESLQMELFLIRALKEGIQFNLNLVAAKLSKVRDYYFTTLF